MKKTLLMLVCAYGISILSAQNTKSQLFVYGIDFSHAKVYAAEESVEQFAQAFEAINMLIATEPEKYDFSRVFDKRVEVVLEPMMEILSTCDYSDLKTLSTVSNDVECVEIIKHYVLPQTEGVGVVLIAKMLNKPQGNATYDLITFDIATREILTRKEVKGKAGGFGLRNFWARSVYNVIKSTKCRVM